MERFDRKDIRFIAVCLIVIAVGGAITLALFRRAFPEASIRFEVNRGEARALAQKFLASRGRRVAGHRFAGRFGVEEDPKVYLERELGLERASRFYGREAKVWRWEMRFFRSGVKEEERVSITPLGDLVAFESVRRDDAPGPRLSQDAAASLVRALFESRGLPRDLKSIEAIPVSRPNRTDWKFVAERRDIRMGEATVRYAATVTGGEVTAFREFVHVPEAWTRDYQKLRSRNETANLFGNLALAMTFLAMIGVLVMKIVRKDVRWGLVAVFGVIAFVLSLLSIANGLPLTLSDYDTASPLSGYLTSRIVLGVLGAVGVGALIALVIASAEPVYRERFPGQLSLSGMFSRRGLRTKRFFRGLLLGYALTAFFFAYQAVFYVAAARFGAWAPAEIPYDDILNTAFPWATVLFIGFLPAVLEEGSSRMFSISLLDRLGAGRFVAVVLPALIWGFNHAAYPNQPFYIRGVEVGLAGIAIGALMLRFGVLPLLVWHFTVDALYTALLLLRSGNPYYVVSGAVSSLILLLPLAAALVLYARKGGFAPEAGLTNADAGFVPAPAPAPPVPEPVAPARPVPTARLAILGVAALLLATSFLLPDDPARDLVRDAAGRANASALARSFLVRNGVAPVRYRSVTYLGTGFADDEAMREIKPEEEGRIPGFSEGAARYVLSKGGMAGFSKLAADRLPLDYWVVRFFQPEKKEEWKVLVDSRRGRVVGFVNPTEEAAQAAPPPDAASARRRTLEAAEKLGYPAAEYAVAEVGTQNRPKRVDTTVVLESRPSGVGDARPRLTAVFHGARLAAFVPSVRIPEEFLRADRKRLAISWLLLGGKIVAIGAAVGLAFLLFLRIVRSPEFQWRRLAAPLLAVAPIAGAALINSFPGLLRGYPTQWPLGSFELAIAVALFLGFLLTLSAAAIAFVLVSGARPGWRRALRRGPLRSALARAGIAAVGVAGLLRWAHVAAARIPASFHFDPSLPQALETALPGFAVLWTAVRATLLAATVAAVAALAASFFRKPGLRVLAAAAILLALFPTSFHSVGELAASFLPSVLTAAWLALAFFLLLADDATAWVLFGAFTYGLGGAAILLLQPAGADRASGVIALLLVVVAAAALIAGRRSAPSAQAAP